MCRNIFPGRWLLSPFRDNGHLTGPQINYNRKHAQTHQVIERALGLLKGRWSRLKYIKMENVKEVPSMVSAACVHNFCLIADEGTIEEFFLFWEWWWQRRWWWISFCSSKATSNCQEKSNGHLSWPVIIILVIVIIWDCMHIFSHGQYHVWVSTLLA